MIPDAAAPTYWSSTPPALLRQLHSADVGLTAAEAQRRLREHGRNIVHSYRRLTRTRVALNQMVVFRAGPVVFRTGWFVESLLTELAIAVVVRTRRPFFKSRPGAVLLWTTVALIAVALGIPYLPFAALLGFVPLSAALLTTIAAITALYVAATEQLKSRFYRRVS